MIFFIGFFAMNKHNLGIIGYGGFGQFLYSTLKEHEFINICAIADIIPPQTKLKSVTFFNDWKELLSKPEIEIVSIATPPVSHAEIACAALGSGKHVLIEKPLATTLSDAKKIIQAQEKSGKVAMVDFMLRFNPLVETIQKLSQIGCFGELRRVVIENYAQDEQLPPDHWFWDKSISGGILVEHGVHFFDLVNFLTSSTPKDIEGFSHRRNQNLEDRFLVSIIYENGLMATYYHSFTRPGFFENTNIRLIWDLAEIELEGWIPLSGNITTLCNAKSEEVLGQFPNLSISKKTPIKDIHDTSRPEGWASRKDLSRPADMIYSSGKEYLVDTLISGSFGLNLEKFDVYSNSVRALMTDFLQAVENPDYQQRITLKEGLQSLRIALTASSSAK